MKSKIDKIYKKIKRMFFRFQRDGSNQSSDEVSASANTNKSIKHLKNKGGFNIPKKPFTYFNGMFSCLLILLTCTFHYLLKMIDMKKRIYLSSIKFYSPMKKIIPILVLVALATPLSAQITREQADSIVQEYLQKETITYNLLYVHVDAPNEEGITITTSNEETFKTKYACWAYYSDENALFQRHYFFVKEDNGSLLEVITRNDVSYIDPTQWKVVGTTGLVDKEINNLKPLYPNPVDNLLNIPCTGNCMRIEIHDLKGSRLFSEILSDKETYQLDVSFLKAGMYLLSVYGETKVVYKIIKK
jgi:hypothetical protein